VHIWNFYTSGPPIRRLTKHTEKVNGVEYSPDGRFLLSAGYDSVAILWDATTFQEITRLSHSKKHKVWSATFSPDGKRIATASSDGEDSFNEQVRVYEVGGKTAPLVTLYGHSRFVRKVAFDPIRI